MLENFIYAKQKSLFEEALNNGEVLDEAIVFIEDTKEIWTHGAYFATQPVIPDEITEDTVNGWGFTKNIGTITEIKMNGTSKGTSGIIDLGTVITEHQDLSGKQNLLISGTNIKTINGESILGEGDLEVGGGSAEIPIVDHGTNDTTFEVTPNIFHKWGVVSNLTLTLATPADTTIANYYMVQFTSGATATTLSVPSSITWANEVTVEANKTYQISILDNLGVIGGF